MMAMPPIVGVPCLAMWCSGPRSSLPRIGWPEPAGAEDAEIRNARARSARRTLGHDAGDHDRDHGSTVSASPGSSDACAGADGAVVERQRPGRRWSACVSWPLPAMTTTSPGRAAATAGGDRRRAVGLDDDAATVVWGRPRSSTASMMAPGSSRARVVRCHDDAIGEARRRRRPSAAAWRGRGRRRQPNTTITRPAATARGRRRAPRSSAVGRVGVVDDHGDTSAGRAATRSKRPGTGVGGRPARRRSASASTPSVGRRRGRGERVDHVEARRRAADRARAARARCSSWWSARRRRRSSASASENGTISIGAASSSSRPCGSSTLTTPTSVSSGVNSLALARKYSSTVPCRSRWSRAEVGEHGGGEARAVDAVQGQGVRRHLHHDGRGRRRRGRRRAGACSSGASGVVCVPDSVPITPVGRPAARGSRRAAASSWSCRWCR